MTFTYEPGYFPDTVYNVWCGTKLIEMDIATEAEAQELCNELNLIPSI